MAKHLRLHLFVIGVLPFVSHYVPKKLHIFSTIRPYHPFFKIKGYNGTSRNIRLVSQLYVLEELKSTKTFRTSIQRRNSRLTYPRRVFRVCSVSRFLSQVQKLLSRIRNRTNNTNTSLYDLITCRIVLKLRVFEELNDHNLKLGPPSIFSP